jgi:outer membrane protein insertion porin family
VLVVVLEERPAIASLEFTGLKAFKPEDLKKGLRDVGLAESRIFDRAMVERAEQELKRQYLSQGYYAVQVTTTITPLERNRVGINFAVVEGDIAKIKQINIVGAGAFKEADLLDLMVLRPPNWITWYTKNDQYSKQKLSGDIETLRSYYLNRGYLEFNVESTQVSISPEKQDIYITINISEGEKYTISSVKLAGQLLVPEEELTKLVRIKPGEVFSRENMTETTKGHQRTPGQRWLCIRQRQRRAGTRQGEAPGGVYGVHRSGAPGLCPAASTFRAIPSPATR